MKKILITGASGFIGAKLIKKFSPSEYEVIAWNRKNSMLNGVKLVGIDMSSENAVCSALRNIQPDIVIHCAGSADVGKSVFNPEIDYEGNVTLTHNLLFALHKSGMDKIRFVFLSSAGVYGNPISLPITENMALNPLSPYAVHKVMCEELCRYFALNYGMDVRIARIFSAYGVGLRKQIFWDMYNKAKDTGKLAMFGTGNESRDYIYIDDVIESLYILSTAQTDEIIFNVANGEEIFIKEATELFAECIGIEKNKIEFNGIVREGDPLNWKADISKIKKLGYKKTVDMKSGLVDYVKWAKKFEVE